MIKLTTIIANYNYGHFLEEAVLSIVKQGTELEILIIDDASTDESRSLIMNLSKHYPNVRYHFKKKNEGPEEAFNTGVKLARGEYIHFFAADDIYLPDSLQTLLEYMDRFPNVSLFCSDFAYFTDIKKIEVRRLLPKVDTMRIFKKEEVFSLFQRTKFWLPGHTVIVKKEAFLKQGLQDKRLGSMADWLINHTLALEEGVGYIPKGLIAMRYHKNNYSSSLTSVKKKNQWSYLLKVLEKEPDKYELLVKTGILRCLGIKVVCKELFKRPKILIPMIKRELMTKNLLPRKDLF